MRLIDADALDRDVLRYASRKHFHGNIEEAGIILKTRQVIHAAPTIDAVEVVRCRDCIYKEMPDCCPAQSYGFGVTHDWYCPIGVKVDAEVKV